MNKIFFLQSFQSFTGYQQNLSVIQLLINIRSGRYSNKKFSARLYNKAFSLYIFIGVWAITNGDANDKASKKFNIIRIERYYFRLVKGV